MTDGLSWGDDELSLILRVTAGEPVHVVGLHRSADPDGGGVPLVELQADNEGRELAGSAQHRTYLAGRRLRYLSHDETVEDGGRRLRIHQADEHTGLRVTSTLSRPSGVRAVRAVTRVRNDGRVPVTLGFVSSLVLTGFARPDAFDGATGVRLARNAWAAEYRWQELSLHEAGLVAAGRDSYHRTTQSRVAVTSTGSWSSGDHLPMGGITRAGDGVWLWQIEHNGGWHWELSDVDQDLCLVLSGPTDQEHQWHRTLAPGKEFTTVPCTVVVADTVDEAFGEMTEVRRRIRRPADDNVTLPVIFNDYMNCLSGDPTEEKLLPLIDHAATLGCDYFGVDAGWYSDDSHWWDSVGEWLPSTTRFPRGLPALLEEIRDRGMVPGLWVEPEVVGVRSPLADRLPDDAFFRRDGRRIVERGRYHLDLGHPAAVAHLDAVIDRLVNELGVGYLKFDYNINIGAGTETATGGRGDGLLRHNRALLDWLDGLFARHRGLVVENCGSGGMRTDYAMLSRLSIHSTSDQTDAVRYAAIAAAAATAVAPEQAASWAYPQAGDDAETVALCMVNAMLGRVHLSGRIDQLDDDRLALVSAGLDAYRTLRGSIPKARPRWPLGLPGWYDDWLAYALVDDEDTYLAVWRRSATQPRRSLTLPWLRDSTVRLEVAYPKGLDTTATWDARDARLDVTLPVSPAARLFRLTVTP